MKSKNINLDPVKYTLENLDLESKNIYLGIDFFSLAKYLKIKNFNYLEATEYILNYIKKTLGNDGNIIIPVFNFDCVSQKIFSIINSEGQSGAFGNILLKKFYNHRTYHPLYSFLCLGKKFKDYKKKRNQNATGKNSLWKNFIDEDYELITLGHHWNRSFAHVHYIENLLGVDYRFNLNFSVKYFENKKKFINKNFSFFARKREICEFSGVTFDCDKLFMKEKVSKFYRYKNLISFKLNIRRASDILIEDLSRNSEKLISYIRPNKINKNVLHSGDGTMLSLEKKYLKYI
jgi:aminoglycoside N3'-acetyltransferase